MNNNWALSPIAYKKIIFHCLRYPSSKVYGALISNQSQQITNAYPLFHSPLLTPSLSIALNLVQSNLEQDEIIIGFYEFIENAQNTAVMNRIINHQPNMKQMMLAQITVKDKVFNIQINKKQVEGPKFESVKDDLVQGKHWKIVDMDSHLEEIQLDFRNKYVN